MVSHRHKCIFVEVPKTGTHSIRSVLGGDPILPHLDIIQIRNQFRFDKYFKFGYVRNPWDRVVSLFLRNKKRNMNEGRPQDSFNEFIDKLHHATDYCIHPTQKKYQLDFFTNKSGKVIVDFIGKFENLQEDFNIICDRVGISRRLLPHLKKTPGKCRKHYTEYYNDETKDLIAQKFSKDIDYFDYEFGK